MKIIVINQETLESQIFNKTGATVEELLTENGITGDIQKHEDNFKCSGYIGHILYHGVAKDEMKTRGRKAINWDSEIATFKAHYRNTMTAKELSVISGLDLGRVYYISRKENLPLKAGVRGRR